MGGMPTAKPLSLAELLALLPRVQATLQLLVGEAGRLERPAPLRAARRSRSSESPLRGKLLVTLKQSKKGFSLGELVKRSGADRGAVQYHLRSLRADKKARVHGTRRQARWLAA